LVLGIAFFAALAARHLMTVLAGVWIFCCVFSLMEERQELLKQLEKWQKSRVSG
jgi:hypothetical protein